MKCSDFQRLRQRDDPMMHVRCKGSVTWHLPASRVTEAVAHLRSDYPGQFIVIQRANDCRFCGVTP